MQSTLEFLQQPHLAIPICALVVFTLAAVRRKLWTSLYVAAALAAFLIDHFLLAPGRAPGAAGPVYIYATIIIGFFAVAVRERAWPAIYVALMPIINWSFGAVPTAPIPDYLGGGAFQPLAIVTGLVLVVRDFTQREIRHWVLGAMLLGLLLSSLTSWIVVVFASGAAFLISEMVDWAVYTFSNRPLSQRIMISSTFSAPLDQTVFIFLASQIPGQEDIFAWGTVLTGIASKLLGAFVVSVIVARQERRGELKPA